MKEQRTKVKASDHESYAMFTLLAILVAPAGFILGILYLAKDSKVDKKLGEHVLAISVLMMIASPVFYYLFLAAPRF